MSISITKRPLLPVVSIQANSGGSYVYNPLAGTAQFSLLRLQFKPVADHEGGDFNMVISSSDGTNNSMNTLLANIEEGNEVSIGVGKTSGTVTTLFLGMIEKITVSENFKSFMTAELSGADWGSAIMQGRIVNGAWEQDKAANGVDVDPSDNKTMIENIVKDLLTKTQYYAVPDYSLVNQGVIVNDANILGGLSTGIKIPQFEANMEKLSDVLKELNHIAGTECYIDHTKNFKMIRGEEIDSGVLATDDYTDSTAVSWNQSKLGLIMAGSFSITKTLENHLRRLIGIGGVVRNIDQKQETASSFTSVHDRLLAMRFKPDQRDIEQIAVYVKKVGTPTTDLNIILVESDSAGNPKGSTIKSMNMAQGEVLTTPSWKYFPLSDKLNTEKYHWILISKTDNDSSNTYHWYHDGSTSFTNAYSLDAVNWTIQNASYGFAYREYFSAPLINIYGFAGLTATSKHFREDVFRNNALKDYETLYKWLMFEGSLNLKRKVIVKCRIYAPDTLLLSQQKIRIRKISSGYSLDDYFTIGEVTYVFENSPGSISGAFYYDIQATKFEHYA